MNIEDLTKTQLLLLTILVNFVTSIATGVLTVSLLDQAPPTVIQTVNRIVDHTIETVTTEVPVVRNNQSSGPSSEDLLTNAIAENRSRTVRMYRTGAEEVSGTGLYIAPLRLVVTTVQNLPGTMTIEFSDGTRVEARSVENKSELNRYLFAEEAVLPSAPSAEFVAPANLKQGQTAIALGASDAAVTGIVTLVSESQIQTDLPALPQGAPVVNLSGNIIGMVVSGGILLPADRMSVLLSP